jgi:hypothetical protein
MPRRIIEYFTLHRSLAFLAIFSLSFVIRFSILTRVPRAEVLSSGEATRIANALVSKGQFADPFLTPTGPTAHTTPFFPLLIAGVYKIFGSGYEGNFVRCVLVVTSYSLLYALYPTFASMLGFPFASGLFAGFMSALLPVKRSAEVFRGWEEPYSAMALALLLFLTLKRWQSPRRDAIGAIWLGLCWGAALYISFTLSLLLVGLFFLDLWNGRSWQVARDIVISSIVVIGLISPWMLRNHSQLHGWSLIRDNLGLELRYSNHDHAEPSSSLLNADPASRSMHPSNSLNEAGAVKVLGEIEYNRRELQLALAWIIGHPGSFLRLSGERFYYFWFGPPEHPLDLIITSFYTALGLAGLTLLRKQVGKIQFQLCCAALVLYPLMYYFVQYLNRYRVPIDWIIWLSAGLVVTSLIERGFRDSSSGEPTNGMVFRLDDRRQAARKGGRNVA